MTDNDKIPSKRDRELFKRDCLMVYLPIAVGVLAVLALVILVSVLGFKQQNLGADPASAGGDTAAIIVLLQVMVIAIVPLLILVALCALFFWLYIKIHPGLKRGQEITEKISQKTDQLTDSMVSVFYKPYSIAARLSTIKRFIRRSSDV